MYHILPKEDVLRGLSRLYFGEYSEADNIAVPGGAISLLEPNVSLLELLPASRRPLCRYKIESSFETAIG